MQRKYTIILVVISCIITLYAKTHQSSLLQPYYTYNDTDHDFDVQPSNYSKKAYITRRKKFCMRTNTHRFAPWFNNILKDAYTLHTNLISFETAALLIGIVPAVLATRTLDHKIHSIFYQKECHKNKYQLPSWTTEVARVINGPTIAILSIRGFFSDDEDFKLTTRTMLISIPFLIYVNQAIKNLKCEMSLRPWNGDFSREARINGGFPSGHISKATYLAVLFGSRFGYKFAVPLTLFAAFTGISFIVSNRHYTSQVIAGIGFGTAYALAASKLVDMRLCKNKDLAVDLTVNQYGGPVMNISYKF